MNLVSSAVAQECYYPLGWFASEVILNKPGVTYDLTKLKETGNMTTIGQSILYRSHYDRSIAVILTPLKLFEEEGLDVRLQMPTKEVSTVIPYIEANRTDDNVKLVDIDLMGGRDLGWVLDLNYIPDPAGGPPTQISNLTKGNIKVTFIPLKNETLPGLYIRIEAEKAESLSRQNRTELSKIFEAIGYPSSFEELAKGLEFKNLSVTKYDLASAIGIDPGGFKWSEAVKTELQWLKRNRVVSGLTDDDIEKVSTFAPYAWGDHNFKTRFFNGQWSLGVTDEMVQANITRRYIGPPDCRPFNSTLLPTFDIVDFNAAIQPLDILAEQTLLGAGIRVSLIIAAALSVVVIYRRRRTKKKRARYRED